MSNYKIRVNSEYESKEAQQLFFELGYEKGVCSTGGYPALIIATPESRFQKTPYSSRATSLNHEAHSQYKEITIPELRDLVVLKRNDVGDATHTDGYCSFYVGKDKNYFFSSCVKAWRGTWKNVDILKPIEKPMKEYLRKNSNGTYSYIGTVRPEHVSDSMIEIPEGATYYAKDASLGKSGNFFFRLRSDDFDFEAVWLESNWIQAIFNVENQDVLWQRNNNQTIASAVESSHPEELPFIDDEPSLNDQYAEIEKVRQSHRTASEIADSALKHIRERAETYDQPTGERSAAKTAKAFNAITGKDITESEVWLLLQLLKDVRQWSREDYHQDSAEDCIAYAALKAESLEGGE